MRKRGVESLIALFLFWFFGLLVGISLGSHNAWFAIFGIFSFVASFMMIVKKDDHIVQEEVEDDAKDIQP